MRIYNSVVDIILVRREVFLDQLLTDENEGLNLESLKPNLSKLLNELDNVFYTLDFLEKENLILIKRDNTRQNISLFNGFRPEESEEADAMFGLMFYYDKLGDEHAMGWQIKMKPGLLAFKNNGYMTDEQRRDSRNFWLTIGIAIGSPALTAFLTTLFGIISE